jgi:hypothetical protein
MGIDSRRHEGVKGIAMTRTRQILFIQGGYDGSIRLHLGGFIWLHPRIG